MTKQNISLTSCETMASEATKAKSTCWFVIVRFLSVTQNEQRALATPTKAEL